MASDPAPVSWATASFEILGQRVLIEHNGSIAHKVITANFGAMTAPRSRNPPDLHYIIDEDGDGFVLRRLGQPGRTATAPGDLLYKLEKDLTVELQMRRADLLFLHAAAVEWKGKAYLLAAESGSGKSTTTWALLHRGFGYVSDELSAIDLSTMQVFPYSHALCLKRPPPLYPLPSEAVNLGRTIHVPASYLPGPVIAGPRPIAGIFILRYSPALRAPSLKRITAAEGAARIYVTTLNALAHSDAGLAPVLEIASRVPCYALSTAGLVETGDLMRDVVEHH
jgi:hypothetical protein